MISVKVSETPTVYKQPTNSTSHVLLMKLIYSHAYIFEMMNHLWNFTFLSISRLTKRIRGEMTLKLMMSPYASYQSTFYTCFNASRYHFTII